MRVLTYSWAPRLELAVNLSVKDPMGVDMEALFTSMKSNKLSPEEVLAIRNTAWDSDRLHSTGGNLEES